MAEPIIGDDTYIEPSIMDGTFARGLIPRDFTAFPVGSYAPPTDIKLVDLQTLPDRIRESEANKSRLSDILLGANIPSLDQNEPNTRPPRWGFCWSHGPVGCMVTLRAVMNQPYVPLSAFGVAFTIKNGKDEGAWSALALDFLGSRGCPPETLWPRFERKIRPSSDPIWLEAAKYRVTAGWMEMAAPVYDRDMSKHQVLSCLIDRIPVSADSNWWGHAYQMCDVVDSFPNKDPKDLSRYGIRGRNSWGDGWGERGFFVLTGSKSVPDNAVAPAVVLAV